MTATIQVRMDASIKEQAEKLYKVPRKDIYYVLIDLFEDIDVIDKKIHIEALKIY